MKQLPFLLLVLTACNQGNTGRAGHDAKVIYPPGKGYNILTRCEHSWTDANFGYKTIYMVRVNQEDNSRVASICNTKADECNDKNFVRQEYPSDALGYSKAQISDGMVTSEMVGVWQSVMTNLYDKRIAVDCDGSGESNGWN